MMISGVMNDASAGARRFFFLYYRYFSLLWSGFRARIIYAHVSAEGV